MISALSGSRVRRRAYHPSVLLKLYIYGYLNRVQSSRRLEREAGRNVEVMWLTGRLAPDHKTIADFRKNNGGAIRKVCSQFVALCRQIGLLSAASVAIDGSKFKAVNNRDRNFTRAKMQRRLKQIDESVARYLHQLDSADRQEPSTAQACRIDRLQEKIGKFREEMQRLKALEVQMLDTPDRQISLTDPDARSMATSGRGSGVVGYNVQTAVETGHHLIIAHDVVQTGNDTSQLAPMADKAKAALETETLDVVADRGYFSSEQILKCDRAGVTVTLPKPQTSSNRLKGMFVKPDFRYVAERDVYICPADEALSYRYTREESGLMQRRYWTNACSGCALKDQCTTGTERRVTRWEHEHLLEDVQRRLDEKPESNAPAPGDRRASLRHHQDVDGSNPLSDETAKKCPYRDGPERARLQSQTGHEHHGGRTADGRDQSTGHTGLKVAVGRLICRVKPLHADISGQQDRYRGQ